MNEKNNIDKVKRAVYHLKAAAAKIKTIKDEDISRQEKNALNITVRDIDYIIKRLTSLSGKQ